MSTKVKFPKLKPVSPLTALQRVGPVDTWPLTEPESAHSDDPIGLEWKGMSDKLARVPVEHYRYTRIQAVASQAGVEIVSGRRRSDEYGWMSLPLAGNTTQVTLNREYVPRGSALELTTAWHEVGHAVMHLGPLVSLKDELLDNLFLTPFRCMLNRMGRNIEFEADLFSLCMVMGEKDWSPRIEGVLTDRVRTYFGIWTPISDRAIEAGVLEVARAVDTVRGYVG